MKTNVKKELSDKTIQELQVQLKEGKNKLFSLKLDHVQLKLKNTRSIFLLRKEIAQILTFLKVKEFTRE